MYGNGERKHYGSIGGNSECGSSWQCDSVCEQRECEYNGRRRSDAVHVCVDRREHQFDSYGYVSGKLYSHGNG